MIKIHNWLTSQKTGILFLSASILIIFCCTLAITATYDKLSHTIDAPNHIATGMEWLQDGTYIMWSENPPLARAAVALGPFLDGARLPDADEPTAIRSKEGIEANCGMAGGLGSYLLYETGDYTRTLSLARAGTLPFFLLSAVVMWFWLGRDHPHVGFISVAAFCTLPAILAHSGLATTDIAFVSVYLLFTWRLVGWLEKPSIPNGLILGLSLGLAVATKFTTLVFAPAAVFALVIARIWFERGKIMGTYVPWRTRLLQAILIIAPITSLVIWGAYRFSIGTLSDLPHHLCGWSILGPDAAGLRGKLANTLANVRLPAPEFFHGVFALLAHNAEGHWAYALGEVSKTGFWYFYPLAMLVKTPLPFMLFVVTGFIFFVKRKVEFPWWVSGLYGTILLIILALTRSHVNIGLRHALGVYALAAVVSAVVLGNSIGSMAKKLNRWNIFLLGILFTWQVIVTSASYPDFIAFFNLFAGDDPGEILVDSDLDWGQGVFQLEQFLSNREVNVLNIAYFGGAKLCDHELPRLRRLSISHPVKGWVAISEFFYRGAASFLMTNPCGPDYRYLDSPGTGWFNWLRGHEPTVILGRSIRLYYIE